MKAALLLSVITFGFASLCLGETRPPNVVIILCDNLGTGDIGCFNPQTKNRTPKLDRMAAEGMRLTSFYAASGVCSPSRAALMTGCYPRRVGLELGYELLPVLKPVDKKGLHPDEETLGDVLKKAGYDTLYLGKWHLGDQPEFLPTRQGFDHFLGIPYSEDMVAMTVLDRTWPELPLLQDAKVIEAPVAPELLTKRLTEAAVRFIAERRDRPFFLFFSETGPGSRRDPFPGPDFAGKSANGPYGDAIEELDWSAGEVLRAIKASGADENTLVIWTTDNGATLRKPPQGSNAPYRGFLGDCSEGAMRVPCVVRWPGKIPAGAVQDELCTMMDLLPTLARLAGASLPRAEIDGHDIRSLLFGKADSRSPYDERGFFYYRATQLQAVRAGDWKLYLPLEKAIAVGKLPPKPQALALYDVRTDPGEVHELSSRHLEIVARLSSFAAQARQTFGDGEAPGSGQRTPGWVETPNPLLLGN